MALSLSLKIVLRCGLGQNGHSQQKNPCPLGEADGLSLQMFLKESSFLLEPNLDRLFFNSGSHLGRWSKDIIKIQF
jgi:hypothetical protein